MHNNRWRTTRVIVILIYVNLWLIVTLLAEMRRILPLSLPVVDLDTMTKTRFTPFLEIDTRSSSY